MIPMEIKRITIPAIKMIGSLEAREVNTAWITFVDR